MFLSFQERIALPVSRLHGYFRTPEDWVRLYGAFGRVEDLGDGWRAVRLARFPIPLIAKITEDRPERLVRWRFRGFWQGEGEIRFEQDGDAVLVEGFEHICPRGLSVLAPLAERLFLEKRFRALWRAGFRRLEREARAAGGGVTTTRPESEGSRRPAQPRFE